MTPSSKHQIRTIEHLIGLWITARRALIEFPLVVQCDGNNYITYLFVRLFVCLYLECI